MSVFSLLRKLAGAGALLFFALNLATAVEIAYFPGVAGVVPDAPENGGIAGMKFALAVAGLLVGIALLRTQPAKKPPAAPDQMS